MLIVVVGGLIGWTVMKRKIVFFTFLLLLFAFVATADCPLTTDVQLGPGPHEVSVTVLWAHEDPNTPKQRYTDTATTVVYGPGTMPLWFEGHPIRATWVIDGAVHVIDCPLFSDNFETGTTGAWSVTRGGTQ